MIETWERGYACSWLKREALKVMIMNEWLLYHL